jgi:proteasome lid subunit RPN8/RPN11
MLRRMSADSARSGTELNHQSIQLILPDTILSLMLSHASSTFPEECCGLLLGVFQDEQKTKRVQEGKPMSNVFQKEERYHRFTIDPKEFMEVDIDAEARGLEIVGIFHSHPNAPAKPSQYDVSHAWPSLSYVVIEVRDAKPVEMKSWVLKDDRTEFVQEKVTMTGDKVG